MPTTCHTGSLELGFSDNQIVDVDSVVLSLLELAWSLFLDFGYRFVLLFNIQNRTCLSPIGWWFKLIVLEFFGALDWNLVVGISVLLPFEGICWCSSFGFVSFRCCSFLLLYLSLIVLFISVVSYCIRYCINCCISMKLFFYFRCVVILNVL